ncbi:MAG: transcription elongation factor GreA [Lactobacillaceae bacterium]|jgi:transcription elongation factor GreA|nr:transcription elongation factor GreA [Lactobacillaceae bacterium]
MDEEKVFPMTQEGLDKIKDELDNLITVRRAEIAQRIKEARQFGDLSENSEYQSAKDDQAFIEGRIVKLQNMIQYAQVINSADVAKNEVSLGKKVTFKEIPNGNDESYTIVGSAEADPFENKISNESPMGQALIGHKTGETIEIPLPNGNKLTVEILHVKTA